MSVTEDAGATLRRLGWRQGAVVPVPAKSRLADLVAPGTTHAVVASQDCDIVAPTSKEPAVDLLPAVLHVAPEGDLLHGKNPRRLCLPVGEGRFATVDVRLRVTVDKHVVTDIRPLGEVPPPRERKLLAKWLGKRYERPAFPDRFNERLRIAEQKLEVLSKMPVGRDITAILMMLDSEEELPSDVPYRVVVWFTCRSAKAEDPLIRVALEKYASRFAETLESVGGIEVAEHDVRTHADITIEDLEMMKRFDFDYRSEAPHPGGDCAPVA